MEDYIKEAKKEFDRLFTFGFAGDSGAGGNDPQEPVYELTETDPRAIWEWHIKSLTEARKKWLEEEIGVVKMNTPSHITREYRDTDKMRDILISRLEAELSKL